MDEFDHYKLDNLQIRPLDTGRIQFEYDFNYDLFDFFINILPNGSLFIETTTGD